MLAFGCQSESLAPSLSHALLILEMIKVQKVKWWMIQTPVKGSTIVQEFDFETGDSVVDSIPTGVVDSIPTGANFYFC